MKVTEAASFPLILIVIATCPDCLKQSVVPDDNSVQFELKSSDMIKLQIVPWTAALCLVIHSIPVGYSVTALDWFKHFTVLNTFVVNIGNTAY